jgi:DNA-binding HxlR family transcriptional regulator
LTGDAVNGRNGCGDRAGARTLNLLAAPLNSQILHALREGAKTQIELRRQTGHPAQTTLRAQLKRLHQIGAIEKQRRDSFPGVLEYELSSAGNDLLPVAAAIDRWLKLSPDGPIEPGSPRAKAAIRAFTEGWSTTMLRALAAKALTLTELDAVITVHNYPSLERRLSAMRLTGLVEAREGNGRGTPYGVAEWARLGIAPLIAAGRWERSHAPAETGTLVKLDIETVFLLASDLLSMPAAASGSCRVAVELRGGEGPVLAGLFLAVRGGRVTSRTTRLGGHPDAWAAGPLSAWFTAIMDRDPAGLELGGDGILARAIVDGLHDVLFGLPVSG